MRKLIDETGNRYGSLTVIKYVGMMGKNSYWLCSCDCGNTQEVQGGQLRNGQIYRCSICKNRDELSRAKRAASVRETKLKTADPIHRLVRERWCSLQSNSNAKRYGLEITEERMAELIFQPCSYCGSKPMSKWVYEFTGEVFYVNGIDRIDSSKGYVEGNVTPCCPICNMAKSDLTDKEFREWGIRLGNHLQGV